MGKSKFCLRCGACCRVIDNFWVVDKGVEEFLIARGYEIIQKSKKFIHSRLECKCPKLVFNDTCEIHKKKPYLCKTGPLMDKKYKQTMKDMGLDWDKVLMEGCGYG